jgi:RHS repeat-associated protein
MAGRGFTGHEWLPWFNMYNMNGRLYDPVVGRFLSPDPVIQDPLATQEYNRYSYCLNNPLKYSDPTGYIKQNVDENSIDWAYLDYLNNRFGGGNGSGSGWGSGYGVPGYGQNGAGLGGVYYDWYSGTYRSTNSGNYEVGWGYASNVTSQYRDHITAIIFSGSKSNPYENLRGVRFTNGSTWYVGEGYTEGYANHGWTGAGGSWGDESFWGDAGFAQKSLDWILAGGPVTDKPVIGGMVPLPGVGSIGKYTEMAKLTKGYKGAIQAHKLVEWRHLKTSGISKSEVPAVILERTTHQDITNALRTEMPFGKKYTTEQMMNTYQKAYPSEWIDYIKILLGY